MTVPRLVQLLEERDVLQGKVEALEAEVRFLYQDRKEASERATRLLVAKTSADWEDMRKGHR